MANNVYIPLETIDEAGNPPASRLNDARAVNEIVQRLIAGNEKRSRADALVYGLVSGNKPYSQSELNKNAQGWRCNTNWRIAESFLNIALTLYWDVISEAPMYCAIRTDHGNDDEREKWSGIISEEFQRLNKADAKLPYMHRLCHHDMVLYRYGPIMFEDTLNYKARAIQHGKLLVPDKTPACVDEWKLAVLLVDYSADDLYSFIRNPRAAARIGYDVKEVRRALMFNTPGDVWPAGHRYDWEWFEQRIRCNDIYFSNITEAVRVAHVFYREFPDADSPEGKISHCMVRTDMEENKFLFRKIGRFQKWHQVIHPFYYDTGDGTHHSVKGLGIKMYGALETYNRMECHAVDSAIWSSAVHMQAADAAALQDISVITSGPYIIHKPGLTYMNVALGSNMNGILQMKQDLINTVTSNSAQYRQGAEGTGKRDRVTKREIDYRAENQALIGKSGMTWYFEQLDDFYGERYRRASNPNLVLANPGGREALAFQKRCKDRGVPPLAMRKIEEVKATRTVGYGSADSRMQAMFRILERMGMYDETGRRRILRVITQADVGEAMTEFFMPETDVSDIEADQIAEATDKVASMKVGVMPKVSPSQNAVIYAQTFLQAGAEAAASLPKGGNPQDVFSFLELAGPAIRAQLDRVKSDPTREGVVKKMEKMWQQLAAVHDKIGAQLKKQMEEQSKQRQQQQQKASQLNDDQALKIRELEGKLSISSRKAAGNASLRRWTALQNEQRKNAEHSQKLALADAETASEIRRARLKSLSE